MVRFDLIGFANENEYLDYFFKTLLRTNWTYDYFVEWQKVKAHVKFYLKEISFAKFSIEGICYKSRKQELKNIFLSYPETIPVIPLIIAMREKNIEIFEFGQKTFRTFRFDKRAMTDEAANDLVEFSDKVGIISLSLKLTTCMLTYWESRVGLDLNVRKNRSGEIFQQLLRLAPQKRKWSK